MPTCAILDLYGDNDKDKNNLRDPIVEEGLFAATGTGLVFVIGNTNGGWDTEHGLIGEVLGDVIEASPVGTPWPRVLWSAKKEALQRYPFLENYLKGVSGVGTMVKLKRGPGIVTGIDPDLGSPGPKHLSILWASSKFSVRVAEGGLVEVQIYDLLGRLVASPFQGNLLPGTYEIPWDQHHRVGSGIYFAHARSGSHSANTKFFLK